MSPPLTALVVFLCVLASATFGLNTQLPEKHLATETKEVVRLATGLIATIAALVLSLLVSSAESSFNRIEDELLDNAAREIVLDQVLDQYGPEAKPIRETLKKDYAKRLEQLFSARSKAENRVDGKHATEREEGIDSKIRELAASDSFHQGLQSRALDVAGEVEMTRAQMHVQREEGIPTPLLVVLVTWLTVIFATFALFAPRNATVVAALFVCALSASGAVFLILEMNTPFTGWIVISDAPMRETLAHLGE